MPSYRDRQFISSGLRLAADKTNAPFVYPRRRVRYFDEITTREGIFTEKSFGQVSKELDRGFIRNLITTSGPIGAQKEIRRRFNFQFNPQDITQAVQMRQDVYLPILQDPSQFAQPLSAVASFGFDILLDRTMEVGSDRGNGNKVNVLGEINPDEDVYQIGVLSDLQVLYGIIGQGFSNELIAENLEMLKAIAQRSVESTLEGDELTAAVSAITSSTGSSLDNDANVGNNAFLIPMPVRVVFSELFMVDGFVTATNVKFTKFNTNMVPIQAIVGLTMNALYIGFTKEKTFLTENIFNTRKQLEEEAQEKARLNLEVLTAMGKTAKQFVFMCDPSDSWEKGLGDIDDSSQWTEISKYAAKPNPAYSNVLTEGFFSDVQFKTGFRDAKNAKNDDAVLQLFKFGTSFTVTYDWTFKVYGYWNGLASVISAVRTARETGSPTENDGEGDIPRLMGYYAHTATASDSKSWEDIRSDSVRPKSGGFLGFGQTDAEPGVINRARYHLTEDDIPSGQNVDDKYFIVNLNVLIEAGGQQIKIDKWSFMQGDRPFLFEEPLTWRDKVFVPVNYTDNNP